MSPKNSYIDPQLLSYIAERTLPEDDFLKQLKKDAQEAGLPEIWISPVQGAVLHLLLKVARAQMVIEVGGLGGYSAIWMARALSPPGCVNTIELEKSYAAFIQDQVAQSDVADRVQVHQGDAREVLKTFSDQSADAMFIDADKAGYLQYLEEARRILKSGGLIMIDNAFAFGQLFDAEPEDPGAVHIQRFNEVMAVHSDFTSALMVVGDGMWVGVKQSN